MLNYAPLQHGMEILDAGPVSDSAELLVAPPPGLAKGQGTLEPKKCNFTQAKPYSTFHPPLRASKDVSFSSAPRTSLPQKTGEFHSPASVGRVKQCQKQEDRVTVSIFTLHVAD